MKKVLLLSLATCLIALGAIAAMGQGDIQTKGSIRGTVTDPNGGVVTGAKVSVTGPKGTVNTTSNTDGIFEVQNLDPGTYTVKVEGSGFKTAVANNVTVNVGKAAVLDTKLEVGSATVTVDVTAGQGVDIQSTATSTNLNDDIFKNIPVGRGVSNLFYLAPGTTDGLGGGHDNPSISGASGLDNLYVADGVNVTDSAFGGIGTFTRSYGPLGTGITTSFIKEVQVKTAGFEAQYGQSQGGIVNIITQSGTNDFHGALYGYMTPHQFEATRKQPDDAPRFNRFGKVLKHELYEVGADAGGAIIKNKLFFFGSFDPTVNRDLVRGAEKNSLATKDSGLRIIRGPAFARRTRTYNYAAKLDWNFRPNHQITFSIFGDPSETNKSSFATLNTNNLTADSVLKYGTRNMALRYNGSFSGNLTTNASFSMGRSKFQETGFDNLNQITDRRGSDAANILAAWGSGPAIGNFSAVGRGFIEPTLSRNRRFDDNWTWIHNMWGQHTIGAGFTYQKAYYSGLRDRSGPHWTIPNNAALNGVAAGQTTNVQFRLRFRPGTSCAVGSSCALFPLLLANGSTVLAPVRLQVIRAEFGVPAFNTHSDYVAGYVQDQWRVNRFITANLGLRWEQEKLTGSPGPSGKRVHYTFTDQWAPRIGFTVDPMGKGNMKIFYNYGRFFEFVPLDMAERSLSTEQDWTGATFVPDFAVQTIGGTPQQVAVVNQYGTVNPIVDLAHQFGAATLSLGDPDNPIKPGTKLGFTDEHTIGYEQQLPRGFTLSVRYIQRKIGRIIEDAASVSPEGALAGIGQVYYIGNISSKFDGAVNLKPFYYAAGAATPSGCVVSGGAPVYFYSNGTQNVCYGQAGIDADGNEINTPDGQPDGFPDPVRKYKALEIELNKRFSNGFQGFFNWRIATLKGNFEGHLRNDNGQTDPAISSLFDFTAGQMNLLGDQFAIGPLNTDRRHVINAYGNYLFSKDRGIRALNGLNVGLNLHFETGLPINKLNPHPVYLNTGEIPIGGRGSQGRTPSYFRTDVHTDYAWAVTERSKLRFTADFFNIFNSQKVRLPDQNAALDFNASTGTNPPNPDFLKPANFYPPFNLRLGIRWEW